MINVTQGMMMNMRNELFEHMEKLPIKYFDTHAHGDIMSIYTNDIEYPAADGQPEYSADHQQRIYDHQCICQYVDLKYSTYGCDDDHGCNYDICTKKAAGQSGKYSWNSRKILEKSMVILKK